VYTSPPSSEKRKAPDPTPPARVPLTRSDQASRGAPLTLTAPVEPNCRVWKAAPFSAAPRPDMLPPVPTATDTRAEATASIAALTRVAVFAAAVGWLSALVPGVTVISLPAAAAASGVDTPE